MEHCLSLLLKLEAKDTYHIILVSVFPINFSRKKFSRSELVITSSLLILGLELRCISSFSPHSAPPGLQLQLIEKEVLTI